MQFRLFLNGGEGTPPPSEFMVIVTVNVEVQYSMTACISTFIRHGKVSNCMAFVIEPRMVPTRFIICIHRPYTARVFCVLCMCGGGAGVRG